MEKTRKENIFSIDELIELILSKVFGELMYCLETDKRGSENRIQTQYANLHTYNPEEGDYYSEDIFEKDSTFQRTLLLLEL